MALILEHLFSDKSSVLWTGVREPQKKVVKKVAHTDRKSVGKGVCKSVPKGVPISVRKSVPMSVCKCVCISDGKCVGTGV